MYAFEYGGYIEKVNSRKNSDEQQQQQQVSRFQAGMLDLASFHAEMGHLKEAEKVGGGQSASAHTHTRTNDNQGQYVVMCVFCARADAVRVHSGVSA